MKFSLVQKHKLRTHRNILSRVKTVTASVVDLNKRIVPDACVVAKSNYYILLNTCRQSIYVVVVLLQYISVSPVI